LLFKIIIAERFNWQYFARLEAKIFGLAPCLLIKKIVGAAAGTEAEAEPR
jgi:hypothetical protein